MTEREREDEADLAAAKEAMKEPGSVPWDEVKRKLGVTERDPLERLRFEAEGFLDGGGSEETKRVSVLAANVMSEAAQAWEKERAEAKEIMQREWGVGFRAGQLEHYENCSFHNENRALRAALEKIEAEMRRESCGDIRMLDEWADAIRKALGEGT